MVKRVVVIVTVWVLGLAWMLTSVVRPAGPAFAVAPAAAPVVHHKTARLCSTVVNAGRVTCYAIRQTDRTSAVRRHIRGFGNAFCLVRGLDGSVTGEFV